MRRCPDIQQFWRQSLCSCGPRTMEQSSVAPERGGLTVQPISAVAKDIFVWIAGPRRTILIAPHRNDLTYLVTCSREVVCSTPGRVAVWWLLPGWVTCHCLWTGKSSRYITNHTGQLSLPPFRLQISNRGLWVLKMSPKMGIFRPMFCTYGR